MTASYRTGGKLDHPVSDLTAARNYLRSDDMTGYVQYADHPALKEVVHHIEWDLTSEQEWEVRVTTTRPLTKEESLSLSAWISGQNSDGLGEGFEQQPFAEHCHRDRWGNLEDDFEMSSFDWATNDCHLEQVK